MISPSKDQGDPELAFSLGSLPTFWRGVCVPIIYDNQDSLYQFYVSVEGKRLHQIGKEIRSEEFNGSQLIGVLVE